MWTESHCGETGVDQRAGSCGGMGRRVTNVAILETGASSCEEGSRVRL